MLVDSFLSRLTVTYVFGKIIPSQREAEGRVNETSSVASETFLMGKIGRHFTEGHHDEVAYESYEGVPQ